MFAGEITDEKVVLHREDEKKTKASGKTKVLFLSQCQNVLKKKKKKKNKALNP